MKKQIQIIGIEHKAGKKKADGTPYDFYVLHGIYEHQDIEGHGTVSVSIPEQEVLVCEVGRTVYLFTHFYNGREYLDAIVPV